MSDSFSGTEPPQTPPRNTNRQHNGNTNATISSPVSSSTSRYSLGMSPVSPLRPEFSAPYARSFMSPRSGLDADKHDDRTQDSKDVLIHRLNDLMVLVSEYDDAQEDSLDTHTLQAKVDDMEKVLGRKPGASLQMHKRSQSTLQRQGDDPDYFSRSSLPCRMSSSSSDIALNNASPQVTKPPSRPQESEKTGMASEVKEQPASQLSTKRAQEVLSEARKLEESLTAAVASLKARQEERDHIHDLLITRAERAAQQIIYLEEQVNELENERNEGEMDILNLQIQLKAIEVQCLNYIPKDADPELLESIKTWKADWSTLKRKRVRIKDKRGSTSNSPRAPVIRSKTTPG